MKKEEKQLLPYNLQFFAEDNHEGEDQNDNQDGKDGDNKEDSKSDEKKFTQKEVSAMMAKEKKEGRAAAIKALGFKSEDEAKKAVSLLNALLDSQKSEEEKNKDAGNKAQEEKSEAEKRANLAESKLTCLMAGVGKDSIDDVMAIALPKVTDDKDLSKVIEEMKKEKRYASFFGGDSGDKGTGGVPGHSGKKDETKGSFGRELAKSTQKSSKKSSYF